MSITGQNKNISKIIKQYDEELPRFRATLLKDVEAHFNADKTHD